MATYKRPDGAYDLMTRLDGVGLSLGERAVLMAQYKFADTDGTSSYVSEQRLCEYLNTSESTIRRHRKSLREKGWLVEQRRGRNTGDTQTSSLYEVVIPTFVQPVEPTEKLKRVHNPTGRNQHSRGQIRPEGLEVKTSQDPSSLEVKFDHLPGVPETDVLKTSDLNGGGAARAGARRGYCSECCGEHFHHDSDCSQSLYRSS